MPEIYLRSLPRNRLIRGAYLMIQRYLRHNVGSQAAALAFYLLFMIFPFLIFISALLGLLQLDVAGILAGLATWWAVHPPAGVAAVLLVPLIADGLLQLCTPYESGNLRRLATGLLFGYGLTVLLLTSLGWAYQWGFGFGKTLLDP